MKIEGKHYFKKIVANTKNSKTSQQCLQALYADEQDLLDKMHDSLNGKGKSLPIQLLESDIHRLLKDVTNSETVYRVKLEVYYYVKYSIGICIVNGHFSDRNVFGKIGDIFL